ncbi:hypothetical protein [Hydrogenovibrio thermophilus]|uniref:DUF4156 domain-containing protein n=1 Tax=Hydrogenovibrio thermophilus TaxID=265883 RepID=A0A410H2G2_9GAMM|nr:hypothetical protein [Hydrogenovibrio thermophilus]QAB15119.1 hypothetical protein EPV75_05260 [Hydrogenovibrio thermophilus]
MNLKNKKWLLLPFSLLIVSCSSVTKVTKVGKDTYTVGSQVRGGMTSWAEVKQMALTEADAYCSSLGQELVSSNIETHGARGWTPQEAEVTFKCGSSKEATVEP